MDAENLRLLAILALGVMMVALFVSGALLTIGIIRLRKMNIPPDATFVETLFYAPLFVVLAIDLLDLALDILAAPLSWIILDRLGLKALRGVAALEAMIPGTQLIPTLTICWFVVRLPGFDRLISGGMSRPVL